MSVRLPAPFEGGGEQGQRLSLIDWSATPLGPVSSWPSSLRTALSLCLSSRAPMMVAWGPLQVQLYNDALAPLIGDKHPAALGRPYRESFPEVWAEVMAPLLADVYDRGGSSHFADLQVFFDRFVPSEEMFWTFSWSPIRDEDGTVVGALHPATETTARVLAERRLRLLRDLAADTARTSSLGEVCRAAVDSLSAHPEDVPFCGVYLLGGGGADGLPVTAQRAALAGLEDDHPSFPGSVDLTASTFSGWPLREASLGVRPVLVDVPASVGELLAGPWPEPVRSALVVPLGEPGSRPTALLLLGVSPRRPYDAEHADFVDLVASQLAAALEGARLREDQATVALELQRALLPSTSLLQGGLEVAARYLPGSTESQVGGDWYDVVPLGAGRTALVVGDVTGRGVRAAALMGQVRASVRAYAQLDLPPEQVLHWLDRLVLQLSESEHLPQLVTCLYAVHDSGEQTLTLASAGHPPPVLLSPTGSLVALDVPAGPPLGVGSGPYVPVVAPLPVGSSAVLYTDGLVGSRSRAGGDGTAELCALLASLPCRDLEHLVDAAVSLAPGGGDDVAVLAVAVPAGENPHWEVVDLRTGSQVVRTARRAALSSLRDWGLPEDVAQDAALVAAELVTNAVEHTSGPTELRLRLLPGRAVVEVADSDARPPSRLGSDPTAEGGRGLMLVEALASSWGMRYLGTGKVVWCELALPS